MLCLVNWLVIAVLFADNLLKKRYEKTDFVAPGPHAIGLENDKTHRRNICSCSNISRWKRSECVCNALGKFIEDEWAYFEFVCK